jgi:hypothetical protein
MIPKPYRNNFDTLSRAFDDEAVCLLECRERATGNPAYVICAVSRTGENYDLVPFARLFDDKPYDLLAPPGELDEPLAEGGRV